MATGDILIASEGDAATPQLSGCILLDPEKACAEALAALLRAQRFIVWGGDPVEATDLTRNREFALQDVLDDFPDANQTLKYPSASIIPRQAAAYGDNFTPSALESTWDQTRGSVFWKLGTVSGVFQLGLWADSKPLRDAMAAQITRVLNPRESMAGVLLRLPETYACSTGRFLLTEMQRIDLPNKAFTQEWELRALVAWDTIVLDQRAAHRLLARANIHTEPVG